jgi:bacillithiol system protein YtxJ
MAFSFFNKDKDSSHGLNSMWTPLNSLEKWEEILVRSHDEPQLVFKHSTRCGISRMVLRNFESEWKGAAACHYLDLLACREVSDKIARDTGVQHQSPQVLLIYKAKSVLDASHQSINTESFLDEIRRVIE